MGAVGEVQFAMSEYQTLPGDEIIVPVRVKDFNAIAGYQFTLTWDAEVIELLEVVNQSIPGYYGEQAISAGILTTSWNDGAGGAVTLNDDAIAFELKFKVVGTLGSSTEIKIGSEITASEAYTDALDLLDIVATNGSVQVGEAEEPVDTNTLTSIFHQQSSIIHLQVQPNPFTNTTNILFTIPQEERIRIEIYDVLGKAVKTFEGNYVFGTHKLEWNGLDANEIPLSAGLYHVRMTAGSERRSVKVALAR